MFRVWKIHWYQKGDNPLLLRMGHHGSPSYSFFFSDLRILYKVVFAFFVLWEPCCFFLEWRDPFWSLLCSILWSCHVFFTLRFPSIYLPFPWHPTFPSNGVINCHFWRFFLHFKRVRISKRVLLDVMYLRNWVYLACPLWRICSLFTVVFIFV